MPAQVHMVAADIASSADVRRLFELIDRLPPLRGVVHAAGVVHDAMITQETRDNVARVFAPKIAGARLLDQHTSSKDLDFFVLFSSVSSLVGNPGQANYSAANAYLDALAHRRRSQGQAATSINWGAISDVGMAARNPRILEYLQSAGLRPMTAYQALHAVDEALADHPVQISILAMDWLRFGQTHPAAANSPRFSCLLDPNGRDDRSSARAMLARLAPQDRPQACLSLTAECIAGILRTDAERLEVDRPLNEFGIDSLMAAELQTAVETTFGIVLSSMESIRGISVRSLAVLILARMNIADRSHSSPVELDDLLPKWTRRSSTSSNTKSCSAIAIQDVARDLQRRDEDSDRLSPQNKRQSIQQEQAIENENKARPLGSCYGDSPPVRLRGIHSNIF